MPFAHAVTTDTLVSLGTGSAYLFSLAGLALGWRPLFFDTSAMVLVLITQGNYLKARATTHSLESLKALARLQSRRATVQRGGRAAELAIDAVSVGDQVLVATGSRVPLDGRLLSTAAELDEGALTGEARPAEKVRGDPLWAGTLNVGNPLELEVTAVGQDMRLAQMVRLVLAAQADKVRAVELTDRLSRYFVPFVLALAAVALPFAMAGRIPPQLAALSMSVSSVLVVGNSFRLRRLRFSRPGAPPPAAASAP